MLYSWHQSFLLCSPAILVVITLFVLGIFTYCDYIKFKVYYGHSENVKIDHTHIIRIIFFVIYFILLLCIIYLNVEVLYCLDDYVALDADTVNTMTDSQLRTILSDRQTMWCLTNRHFSDLSREVDNFFHPDSVDLSPLKLRVEHDIAKSYTLYYHAEWLRCHRLVVSRLGNTVITPPVNPFADHVPYM